MLVVADRPDVVEALVGPACRVVSAPIAADALRLIGDHEFAAIVLDVRVPDAAARRIAEAGARRAPIVVIGANGDPGEYRRAYAAGAVDCLADPIDAEVLRAKVRVFADLHRAHRRSALEAARDAVAARDEFLSIASHELRTPLMTLRLRLDSLAHEVDPSTRRSGNAVRASIRAAERLVELVDGMLDVSRIATGRLTIDPQPFDLVEAVHDVIEQLGDAAQRAGCTLVVGAAGPVVGQWDRVRVAQIIQNLVDNAIKYAPHSAVEIEVSGDAEGAVVTVADHGIGIAPEDAERVFGQFERAVSVQHYGGLGMGLYIARAFAIAHGGTISVVSAPGEGSTFKVALPNPAVKAPPGSER